MLLRCKETKPRLGILISRRGTNISRRGLFIPRREIKILRYKKIKTKAPDVFREPDKMIR